MNILCELPEDEVKVLLTKWETLYNVSAVFHPISGAAMLYSDDPLAKNPQTMLRYQIDGKDNHMKILIKLLTLGVDVNARDVGGRTPLHFCCSGHSRSNNIVTKKMAERLIRAGANVNSKNRCGETSFYTSAEDGNIDLVLLLLSNGADPNIPANDGRTPFDVGPPHVRDSIGEFEKKRAIEERKIFREAVGGSFRQCGVCQVGLGEKVMRERCTGRNQ